jgi:hypothetical protein
VSGADLSAYPDLGRRPEFFDRARCRDPAWRDLFHALMSADRFQFPRWRERERAVGVARWACAACPVRESCHAWALAELSVNQQRLCGVVGGSTVEELRRELRGET